MYLRNRNTLLNYIRFCIPNTKLNDHFLNIKNSTSLILYTNNIKVIDSVGKIVINDDVKSNGFMITYLLSDESYLSTYAYTDKTVGKLSINLVTRYTDPLNHYNSIVDLNHFFTNKYLCILDTKNIY